MAKKRDHLSLVKKGPAPFSDAAATRVVSENGAGPSSEVDELYQKPLGEFTTARNALAKRLGKDGADVKKLEKPSAPAWAVNQLYWHERAAYDRLIEASDALRAEHRKHLSGKAADIRAAEKTHREAVREAGDTIRGLLKAAGDAASPATMMAVTETLEALPSADPPGRLVRPLKPQGFEALAGLAARPASLLSHEPRRASEPPRAVDPAAQKKAEEARRAVEAAEREAEAERERQRAARAKALGDAEAAVERARAALDVAHQEVERRSEALAQAREALRQVKRSI
jgi:hypothetical protein